MASPSKTTIFTARRILTMNPARPSASAVAVRDGRIVGVGTVDELATWGDHEVDSTFADHVLLPGFVEAHSHAMVGGMWTMPYVGFFDRVAPDGEHWPGCKSINEVLDRLHSAAAEMDDPNETMIAWGLDPIYFDANDRLLAEHLDRVSDTRPIFVYHVSGHLATVNTALLKAEGIDRHTPTPGVSRRADGEPDGELQEPAAMSLAKVAFGKMRAAFATDDVPWNYAYEARNAGHTTITDLGTTQLYDPEQLDRWRRVTSDPDYPARVMVAAGPGIGGGGDHGEYAALAVDLRDNDDTGDKLHFGIVKIILDGSIQGFTARISWPHYHSAPDEHPGNGLWLMDPSTVADVVGTYHRAGLTVHCHCNGDEASEVFISAVEQALESHPRWDHRHTVQHSQLTTKSQYRRMAELGMAANIFSNHIFYWGDQHRELTVGPERAACMNACATALREGVSFSFHSDTPVTPMGHLHVAWCAVNRQTATEQVLGPNETITVEAALHAATVGAAYQIKMDHLVGSIEAGKFADFAVLDDDPLTVDPTKLRDIGVWGTVLGGVPRPSST